MRALERDRRSGRGQALAQMAIAWTLRDPRVTSALIGASSVAQLEQNVAALERLDVLRRRAGRDRPPRRRLRHQPVGGRRATRDGARGLPAPARDRHALGRQRRLRARQQRPLLRVLRHRDQRRGWSREGGLDIHAGDGDRAVRGVALRLHGGDRVPRRRSRSGCAPAHIGSSSVRYELAVFRPARTRRAGGTGWFVHVFVDRATRRPGAVPAAAARGARAAQVTA